MTAVGEGPARAATIQSGVEPVLPDAPRNLALSNIDAFSVLLQFTPGFDGNSSISSWTVQVIFKVFVSFHIKYITYTYIVYMSHHVVNENDLITLLKHLLTFDYYYQISSFFFG